MIDIIMTRFGDGDDIKVILNAQASSSIKWTGNLTYGSSRKRSQRERGNVRMLLSMQWLVWLDQGYSIVGLKLKKLVKQLYNNFKDPV